MKMSRMTSSSAGLPLSGRTWLRSSMYQGSRPSSTGGSKSGGKLSGLLRSIGGKERNGGYRSRVAWHKFSWRAREYVSSRCIRQKSLGRRGNLGARGVCGFRWVSWDFPSQGHNFGYSLRGVGLCPYSPPCETKQEHLF
jgi:hypothetical protein